MEKIPGWNRGPSGRGYGAIRDLAPTRERKTAWWNGDFSARRRLGESGFVSEGALMKPTGLAPWTPKAKVAEAAKRHNAERPISPAKRAHRIGRRGAAAILSLVLIAGLAAAAYLYFSNKITGTVTPSGGLTLTGAFATSYPIGTPVSTDWDVINNAGSGILFSMEFNATAPGISCANIVVNMPSGAATGTLNGNTCTYDSAPIATIAPGGNQIATVSLKFLTATSYQVSMQTLGN